MLRLILIFVLIVLVARAFWRVVDGVIEGLSGRAAAPRGRPAPMVRDPVCGTFVLPDHAVAVVDGSRRVYFCSTACRDKYQPAGRRAGGRSA